MRRVSLLRVSRLTSGHGRRPTKAGTSAPCSTISLPVTSGQQSWAPGAQFAEVGARLDGDVLGVDPLGAYDASATVAAATFEAPGALEAPCAVSYGPVPGSVYAGHRFIDVLIHGWDLAVATRQDTRMDPSLVEACFAVLEPQFDQLKASGAFGTEVAVPADADPQTRLLAMLGRRESAEIAPTGGA